MCAEDHPVCFGLNTLRYLGLFVLEHLVVPESVKISSLHKVEEKLLNTCS